MTGWWPESTFSFIPEGPGVANEAVLVGSVRRSTPSERDNHNFDGQRLPKDEEVSGGQRASFRSATRAIHSKHKRRKATFLRSSVHTDLLFL